MTGSLLPCWNGFIIRKHSEVMEARKMDLSCAHRFWGSPRTWDQVLQLQSPNNRHSHEPASLASASWIFWPAPKCGYNFCYLCMCLHSSCFPLCLLLSLWPHSLLLLSHFSRVRLCVTPIDSSPPGSPIPGILQARRLEWVAISFSGLILYAALLSAFLFLCFTFKHSTRRSDWVSSSLSRKGFIC